MNIRLTQAEFDVAAAAWRAFIDSATLNQVRELFQFPSSEPAESAKSMQYQTFVSFDLADTIPYLLSTVGIRQVMARFVLVPNTPASTPRFRIVLYAADERGGRISAYYQGDSDYHDVPPSTEATDLQDPAAPQGQVPFSLISNWLKAWGRAANAQQLNPAQFATSYGPLQGYNFELGDFMDQLFVTTDKVNHRVATQLRLNFGLKTYFPAYPEALTTPVQTFGLVVRLFWNSKDLDGTGDVYQGGSSYDMSASFPPG